MKRLLLFPLVMLFANPVFSDDTLGRPAILGIGSVDIAVANVETPLNFYARLLGLSAYTGPCEVPAPDCLRVNAHQYIKLLAPVTPQDGKYMPEILFETSNVSEMRSYLTARGVRCGDILTAPTPHFVLVDPDGHRIGFIQFNSPHPAIYPDNQVSGRLIHAGFVVHDRAAEDHFYKDILGFHVYWHGGAKDDGVDDWVAMQVPDGSDWLEYMLRIPADANRHTLGVANHISLGVPDIQTAYKRLVANGWKPTEQPKLGRDGKWQLNLYDPDDTRIEFMEFATVEKPCCSPVVGTQPGPYPGESRANAPRPRLQVPGRIPEPSSNTQAKSNS
jgi:catechol 2,3-dioxygenase-like lactoylglutathione lyase family enzyme